MKLISNFLRKSIIHNKLSRTLVIISISFLFSLSFLDTTFPDDSSLHNKFSFLNADSPLYTPTYDGSNEAVHPSVVYIEDGFNGYRFWMALTPYPKGNDTFENPQILVSNDGINFSYFKDLKSCLALPRDVNKGGHYSDVNLCYTNDELEIYFRYNPHLKGTNGPNNSRNYVYRMKSKDGVNWSNKRVVLNNDTFPVKYNYVSPTILFHNGVYNIWFSNYSTNLYYTQTKDWKEFTDVSTCNFINKPKNLSIWHHDIIKVGDGYEAVISAYKDTDSTAQSLYHSYSKDGISFYDFTLILKPRMKSSFDNGSLYKGTLVKVKNQYFLYYSARNKKGHWHIGLAKKYSPSKI